MSNMIVKRKVPVKFWIQVYFTLQNLVCYLSQEQRSRILVAIKSTNILSIDSM